MEELGLDLECGHDDIFGGLLNDSLDSGQDEGFLGCFGTHAPPSELSVPTRELARTGASSSVSDSCTPDDGQASLKSDRDFVRPSTLLSHSATMLWLRHKGLEHPCSPFQPSPACYGHAQRSYYPVCSSHSGRRQDQVLSASAKQPNCYCLAVLSPGWQRRPTLLKGALRLGPGNWARLQPMASASVPWTCSATPSDTRWVVLTAFYVTGGVRHRHQDSSQALFWGTGTNDRETSSCAWC